MSERGLPRAVLAPRQELRPPSAARVEEQGGEAAAVDDTWTRREVAIIGEVWRVDDEWWRQAICRRYIEVVLEGGKHTVLYRDLNTNEWFEQAP